MDRIPPKERIKVPRQAMPEQDPGHRTHNFAEVNLGLLPVVAQQEAQRCLSCAKPACTHGCPVGVKVREFIELVLEGKFAQAAAKVREDNVLPGITGRVCPQEDQCEGACVIGKKAAPIAIGYLERFVADWEQASGTLALPPRAPRTGRKVAIVGSGPAGLACAGDLVQKGHDVTVFEALHELGGVLVYGIPEFRLPRDVVAREIDNLRAMGVDFQTNVVVGRTVTIDQLLGQEGYSAVFVATGAGLPQFMNLPGEHWNGVYSANEFLTRVNLLKAYRDDYDQPVYDCHDKEVIVVGGGNVALDAVRTALRLGARTATIVYRRSEADMPAREEEIKHALAEGVRIMPMTSPVAYLGNDAGWLRAARCQRLRPGEVDSSGRPRPVPIEGSEFDLPCHVAIVAIGTTANPLIRSTTPDLRVNKWGYIEVNDQTMRTNKRGVFAGGDIVTGAATVILAMGAGRKAATSIHEWLTTGQW